MRYDFESIIDRSRCGSSKWEGMKQHNPNVAPDVMPLSVADMEFKFAGDVQLCVGALFTGPVKTQLANVGKQGSADAIGVFLSAGRARNGIFFIDITRTENTWRKRDEIVPFGY